MYYEEKVTTFLSLSLFSYRTHTKLYQKNKLYGQSKMKIFRIKKYKMKIHTHSLMRERGERDR